MCFSKNVLKNIYIRTLEQKRAPTLQTGLGPWVHITVRPLLLRILGLTDTEMRSEPQRNTRFQTRSKPFLLEKGPDSEHFDHPLVSCVHSYLGLGLESVTGWYTVVAACGTLWNPHGQPPEGLD